MKKIYMDYAATSPIKPEVLAAMKPYFSQKFGNSSSIHSFGREARAAIDKARTQVAKFLNCLPEEIIFTSGGTESDNLAIRGIIKTLKHSNIKTKPHIITSAFEHHAILHTCQDLEKQGLAEVTYVRPDREGIISVEDVKKAIKPNTVLVSIMYVNNEIGTVQPVGDIGEMIRRWAIDASKIRNRDYSLMSNVYFHTDAVQAIEYFDCDVRKLGVDMLSLSAHKFGGPKGMGALYVKIGTPIASIQTGGAQESNHRAGTENVAGIVGLGKAISLINASTRQRLTKLRDYFINKIQKNIPDVILNGSKKFRSPNNVNFSFLGAEGESILLNLDLLGIAASSGSACASGSLAPSHVLSAIGCMPGESHSAVRFTLGEKTSKQEIDYVVKNLVNIIKKLRKMSPYFHK